MKDGPLAFFNRPVRDVLNNTYQDKWVGRTGAVTVAQTQSYIFLTMRTSVSP